MFVRLLCRLGEEKEAVVRELQGERRHHEEQLVTMVTQQENILAERQGEFCVGRLCSVFFVQFAFCESWGHNNKESFC